MEHRGLQTRDNDVATQIQLKKAFFQKVEISVAAGQVGPFTIPGGFFPAVTFVELNGSDLTTTQFTTNADSNGYATTITLVNAPSIGSVLVVKPFTSFQVANALPAGGTAANSNKWGGLSVPPSDGQAYAYRNGAWIPVAAGELLSLSWYDGDRAKLAVERPGCVPRDGGLFNRADYPEAWARIRDNYNPVSDAAWVAGQRAKFSTGDGSTTFRVPDTNGKYDSTVGALFIRGDGARTTGVTGDIKQDSLKAHRHRHGTVTNDGVTPTLYGSETTTSQRGLAASSGNVTTLPYTETVGDTETAPVHALGCFIIRLASAGSNVGTVDVTQLATQVELLKTKSGSLIKETYYSTAGGFTHTFQSNTSSYEVELWGAGGGGGPSSGATAGGNTTFGTLIAGGGGPAAAGFGGVGGVPVGGNLAIPGQAGGAIDTNNYGSPGGSSPRGGGGGRAGNSSNPGTVGGFPGGGGGVSSANASCGGGGAYVFERKSSSTPFAPISGSVGAGGTPGTNGLAGGGGLVVVREYTGGGPNVDLIAGLRLKQKFELLWSGNVGSTGVVLPLSAPLEDGDMLCVVHNNTGSYAGPAWPVLAEKMVSGQVWYPAPGLNTALVYNSPTQFTSAGFSNGYGLLKIYRLRAGV